ncbi:MAG TPA: hypothetical protein VF707_21130 [Ardenticatenaceae bacterium]
MNMEMQERGSIAVGSVLVGVGLLALLGQRFDFNLWNFAWPFFVILPGLFFFAAMVLGGRKGGVLAIPGSIVTTVGLILLYQNSFDHWASWAYAWSLIMPTALGVGLMISGLWSNEIESFRRGRAFAVTGLAIFAVGFTFFEGLLNISGFAPTALGSYLLPALLIGGGLLLLLRNRLTTWVA